MKSFIVSISGASGSIYGVRLIEALIKSVESIYLCISEQSFPIINLETGADWAGETTRKIEEKIQDYYSSDKISFFSEHDLAAPIASGSFITDGMFIVPCSMKTLSAVANGYADNLTVRAADVALKERRKLIISPREMPFSAIHLENMLKLSRLGVTIAPPVPAYYQQPKDLNDIVNFVVGKLLDSAGIEHDLFNRWG